MVVIEWLAGLVETVAVVIGSRRVAADPGAPQEEEAEDRGEHVRRDEDGELEDSACAARRRRGVAVDAR